MKKVVLFGNGAVAHTTYHDLSLCSSEYEVAGFSVDADYLHERTLFGLPVVPFGQVQSVFPPDQCDMLVAIGYTATNRLRAERYLQAKEKGYRLVNFVSPNTVIYPGLEIGDNCHISHNCTIFQDVRIGNNVTVGANSVIGHDVFCRSIAAGYAACETASRIFYERCQASNGAGLSASGIDGRC